MKKKINHIVGGLDKEGRKIVEVSPEGWYKTADGSLRDPDGYEWFANDGITGEVDGQEVKRDEVAGGTIVVRDFKFAVNPLLSCDPEEFWKHWKPTIEATMVETGWDYDDETRKNPAITMGQGEDGLVHVYVRMKKKAWKNRDNAYQGARQGQHGKVRSEALVKAGAKDPFIHGTVETGRVAADILSKRK